MHTASSSPSLSKDYTLPSADVTTLTKQQDNPQEERRTRVYTCIYSGDLEYAKCISKKYLRDWPCACIWDISFSYELETHRSSFRTRYYIFRRRKGEFDNMYHYSFINPLSVLLSSVGYDFSRESKDSSR